VNGWDLQHAYRVRWCNLPQEYNFGSLVFGPYPTRFSRTWDEKVIDYTISFLKSPPTYWQTASLPTLPEVEPELVDVPDYLKNIVAEAHDLVSLLYTDRQRFGDDPSENELVAHFVVPFLRAHGWPPEQIAVEWKRIDVAVFKDLPRIPEKCQFIIEAKYFGAGVEGALDQAIGYAKILGMPLDVIVTDGLRYRMYSCSNDFKNDYMPVAYANMARLKKSATGLFSKIKRP